MTDLLSVAAGGVTIHRPGTDECVAESLHDQGKLNQLHGEVSEGFAGGIRRTSSEGSTCATNVNRGNRSGRRRRSRPKDGDDDRDDAKPATEKNDRYDRKY